MCVVAVTGVVTVVVVAVGVLVTAWLLLRMLPTRLRNSSLSFRAFIQEIGVRLISLYVLGDIPLGGVRWGAKGLRWRL